MIYTINARITCDTRTQRVVIETAEKRLAMVPLSKGSSNVFVSLNDKPDGQMATPVQVLKAMTRHLYGRKQVKKLVKEVNSG